MSTTPLYDGILTEDQLLDSMLLLNEYTTFWDGRFSDMSVFDQSEVEHLLEEVAEIVVLIRDLRAKQGKQLPSDLPLVGMAKEYLWSLESLPPEDQFVRDMIHATLMHAGGYIDSLTEAIVDDLIFQVVSFNTTHEQTKHHLVNLYIEGKEAITSLKKAFEETAALVAGLDPESHTLWSSTLVKDARSMNSQLEELNRQIRNFEKRRGFKSDQSTKLKERCEKPAEPQGQKAAEGKAETMDVEEPAQPQQQPEEDLKGMIEVKMVAEEVEGLLNEVKDFASATLGIEKVLDVEDPLDSLHVVKNLQKKGRIYLDSLMKDLLKLDSLSGAGVREARKKQVAQIQDLMDNIEHMQTKLSQLEHELQQKEEVLERVEKEREEKEKVEREQKEREERERLEKERRAKEEEELRKREEQRRRQQEEYQRKLAEQKRRVEEERKRQAEMQLKRRREEDEETEEPSEGNQLAVHKPQEGKLVAEPNVELLNTYWKRMKLEVEFEVLEKTEGYVLVANIPDMKEEDIKIQVTPDPKLVVKGFRGPTARDLEIMNRVLDSKFTFKSEEERLIALLKIGVGRFGTFEAVYHIPSTVDSNNIKAQYNNGVLKVFLPRRQALSSSPKVQQLRNPQQQQQATRRPTVPGRYPYGVPPNHHQQQRNPLSNSGGYGQRAAFSPQDFFLNHPLFFR